MPFARPTLAELITRIRGDLRGRLEIAGPLLRKAMADVIGAVWGGAVHSLYGYLDWLSRQLFIETAEREALLRRAKPYGMSPTAAQFASGTVTATGTNGTVIPINTLLRLDAATTYHVTVAQTIAAGTAAVPIAADIAGTASNLIAGAAVSLQSPIAGVNGTMTVVADITNGVDEESTAEFGARFELRLQEPPEGGAEQDYIGWAEAAPGVTRAWVFPLEQGKGTVVVRFVNDLAIPIFPDPTAVAVVQSSLDARRPITVIAIAVAPTQLNVAFTIHIVPDTTDTRAAVVAELTDLFVRLAQPGNGAGKGTVLLSQIRTAIGVAAGVTDYVLTVPSADVVPGLGQLPTVGTVTWV